METIELTQEEKDSIDEDLKEVNMVRLFFKKNGVSDVRLDEIFIKIKMGQFNCQSAQLLVLHNQISSALFSAGRAINDCKSLAKESELKNELKESLKMVTDKQNEIMKLIYKYVQDINLDFDSSGGL